VASFFLPADPLAQLEEATRRQYATRPEVEGWIEKGWLTAEQASLAFAGFDEVIRQNRRSAAGAQSTDYGKIKAAYEEYSLASGKGGEDRANLKTHRNNLSMASQVISWLEQRVPCIAELTSQDVRKRLEEMRQGGYTNWTVSNYLTKTRILLDQAISLGLMDTNPAREVRISQPRVAQERRVLGEEEAIRLLEASLSHRSQMSGCLPTVVRLGLYAGLRNQEMCWLKWDAIAWDQRIISIKETTCEETRRTWVPKDSELRRHSRAVGHQLTRRSPRTKSKWVSRLTTGRRCSRLKAAIHASLVGIGVPARLSSWHSTA
jgi:integrase